MNKYKYHILAIAIILVTFVSAKVMMDSKKDPKSNKKKVSTTYVKTSSPTISEINASSSYRGRISFYTTVHVSADVTGKIVTGDVDLKDGMPFKKGDIIFSIYSKDKEAALKASKGSFLQTLANILPDISIDYPKEYEKWNNFFASIKLDKKLPTFPKINSNKERVFLASNNVLTNYYNIIEKEIILSKYIVRAPFDGSMQTVYHGSDDIVSTGTVVTDLVRYDKCEVTVPILINDVKWAEIGDKATITFTSGKKLRAELLRISDVVDEETQSVNVYLRIDRHANDKIKANEYVDVGFDGKPIKGILIPREAIVNKNYVYQLKNKALELNKVNVIRELADNILVIPTDTVSPIVMESITKVEKGVEYLSRK